MSLSCLLFKLKLYLPINLLLNMIHKIIEKYACFSKCPRLVKISSTWISIFKSIHGFYFACTVLKKRQKLFKIWNRDRGKCKQKFQFKSTHIIINFEMFNTAIYLTLYYLPSLINITFRHLIRNHSVKKNRHGTDVKLLLVFHFNAF